MNRDTSMHDDHIRKKINKIFDNFIVNDSADALNTISGLYTANFTSHRSALVNEIEKQDLIINKSILSEYGKVKNTLGILLNSLNTLNSAVQDMSSKLQDCKIKTSHLINKTTQLKDQRKKTEKKLLWTEAFVKHFETSSKDVDLLHSTSVDAPLSSNFFRTLGNIEKIYDDTKILIKCCYQTSALDIMESLGIHQEAAIEKLYRWTVGACRNVDSSNYSLVPKALSKFQNRQVLFSNIIDEYCTARKSIIVRQFIDALTKGIENGSKPIEFYADDPKRYIGDILTWVYQVIPVEKENLNSFFKNCDEIEKDNHISDAITSIMEAVCPLLNVRAELILKPDKEPLVLWTITNLILYYNDVIQKIIPKGQLVITISELLKKSEEAFLLSLDIKIQKDLSHGVKAPPSDLNPSIVVTDLVSFLRDLLSITNMTNNFSENYAKIIITHILDPLLKAINETACHLSSSDMSVYLLNCIYHIQCTLSLYTIMDDYNERLQAQSEAQIDTLTSEQASFLVANLNMGPIYTILQEKINGPMSAIPGMDNSTLKTFLHKFDIFVASPETLILPQLNLLLSNTQRTTVKKRAFQVILAIYTQLYQAINNPENQYTEPNQIIRRTPEEIKKILMRE